MRDASLAPEALGADPIKAAARAETLNTQWDQIQAGKPAGPILGTMTALIRDHQASDEYKARAATTNEEVDRACAIIEARFGRFHVSAIRRRHIKKFYADQRAEGSLHRANVILKWLRYLLYVAVDEELIVANPAAKMKVTATDPRNVIWSEAEIDSLERSASELGRPSVALAIRRPSILASASPTSSSWLVEL